jgi:hypothetical protein
MINDREETSMADGKMDFKDLYFPRTGLAQEYLNVFNHSDSRAITLFGPRGIGKTALLQRDLTPLAAKSGRVPVYIDLWSSQSDPGALIADRLREETQKLWGAIRGKKEIVGGDLAVAGFKVGAHIARPTVEEPEGATRRISLWMSHLAEAGGKKKILLLLDEVQTLARSPSGVEIAASLRAGMQTNYGRYEAVFTGSSRDQLAGMFKDLRAPLWNYGDEQFFPTLGQEFTDAVSERYDQVTGLRIDREQVWKVFKAVGSNPQTLIGIVRTMALDERQQILDEDIKKIEAAHIARDREIKFNSLSPLERAIVVAIAAKTPPFGADAMRYYAEVAGEPVSLRAAQQAINRLRSENILYQPAAREYRIENPLLSEWLEQRQPQALGYITPFAVPPAFEDAIPAGQYTGIIESEDVERILQNVGEGRVLSHRRASKRHGDETLLKPGRIATISYSGRSWDIRDPNVQTLGGPRAKGQGRRRR